MGLMDLNGSVGLIWIGKILIKKIKKKNKSDSLTYVILLYLDQIFNFVQLVIDYCCIYS